VIYVELTRVLGNEAALFTMVLLESLITNALPLVLFKLAEALMLTPSPHVLALIFPCLWESLRMTRIAECAKEPVPLVGLRLFRALDTDALYVGRLWL
jgi:hypothetical protein